MHDEEDLERNKVVIPDYDISIADDKFRIRLHDVVIDIQNIQLTVDDNHDYALFEYEPSILVGEIPASIGETLFKQQLNIIVSGEYRNYINGAT